MNQTKPQNLNDITPTVEEFNMPSQKAIPSSSLFYTESNKFESSVRQFSKQQSAGSTCSIANSICSSTAATIGSISTTVPRNKRKKNFEEEEEDEEDLQFTGDSSSDIVGGFKADFNVGDNIEIVANQDGSQHQQQQQHQHQ